MYNSIIYNKIRFDEFLIRLNVKTLCETLNLLNIKQSTKDKNILRNRPHKYNNQIKE